MARFLVTHDFAPSGDGQIAVTKGETVTLVERNDSGWATVIRDNGQKGFVSLSFLVAAADGAPPLPAVPVPAASPYQHPSPGAVTVQVNQVNNNNNRAGGSHVNHCCHCVTCAVTGGLWLPCWVLACVGVCDACAGCRCG